MKTKLIFLLPLLLFFIHCSDSDNDSSMTLSNPSFENVSADGEVVRIKVKSDAAWRVSSDRQWCIPYLEEGKSNGELMVSVVANLEGNEREAKVTIMSSKSSQTIRIKQKASNRNAKNYHYQLPVIFHVLYKDKADALQYVSANRLAEILNEVNKLYKDAGKSIDMNLTFTLATMDPYGNTLETPGVEYIPWTGSYPIDCNQFMHDRTSGYVDLLWEPNLYINVMVYNFEQPHPNMTILGVSNLAYSTQGETYLQGLVRVNQSYLKKSSLPNPHCVSINSLYINSTRPTSNINATVAHELGHYLGLYHVFNEGPDGDMTDDCIDSDYCADTPPYNKLQYDIDIAQLSEASFSTLAKRISCDTGEEFTSRNIMDYSYGYMNQFTPDQYARVRHVLMYSPLIPGPKIRESVNVRAADEGVLDLPIRVVE